MASPSKTEDFMNQQIVKQWNIPDRATVDKPSRGSKRHGGRLTPTTDRDQKKPRKAARPEDNIDITRPTYPSFSDIGGADDVIKELAFHLPLPLRMPGPCAALGITSPRGILIHGPPGCGKTSICKACAVELRIPFIEILGPSIVSSMSGESEKQIRDTFQRAKDNAPCLIFIDEIEVLAPKRDNAQSQMEKRIVAQLMVSMDSLATDGNDGKPVIVLAATNRPDSLDPGLRRGARFGTEINMGVPDENARELILRALTRRPAISDDVDYRKLANRTAGFVGADLSDLVSKAGIFSLGRFREALVKQALEMGMGVDDGSSAVVQETRALIKRLENQDTIPLPPGFENTAISMSDFEAVLPTLVPSCKREGFATVPDINWSDIGAYGDVRQELEMAVVEPIVDPGQYAKFGLKPPSGVLLWGPPGCGKTLLAKAAANESGANFISVKGPELLDKYVGESERAIRQVFMRARSSVPCVVFFDEFDAITPRRTSELHEASVRVVNTLLTELDGIGRGQGIYVVAATNRPDMIDDAILRPGRLETLLYVRLPEPAERVEILRTHMRKMKIDPLLADAALEEECNDFSGADLESLIRKASQNAMRRRGEAVEKADLVNASKTIKPSVGDKKKWEQLRKRFETTLS